MGRYAYHGQEVRELMKVSLDAIAVLNQDK